MNAYLSYITLFAALFFSSSSKSQDRSAILKLKFEHVSGSNPLVLRDSVYTTPLGETFTISKLKYYTSDFRLNGDRFVSGDQDHQLVDISKETEILLTAYPGKFHSIGFTIGVDSARNFSGAQAGALDPMNDMFWTWNSGYVVFKLDGTSPASNSDRNRIEHHIGGYRPGQNVSTQILFKSHIPILLRAGDTTTVIVRMDLEKYWKSENDILISREPVCTLPGQLAMKIAANFRHMFTLIPPESL